MSEQLEELIEKVEQIIDKNKLLAKENEALKNKQQELIVENQQLQQQCTEQIQKIESSKAILGNLICKIDKCVSQ